MIQPIYSFFNDLLKLMSQHKPLPVNVIHLVGSRMSGKTRAAEEFICKACDIADIDGKPIATTAYVVRNFKNDVSEVYEQYLQGLDEIDERPDTLRSYTVFNFPNGNTIKFRGLGSRSGNHITGAGLSAASGEYIILVFEEAFEYEDRDKQRFREAVRGKNKDVKILEINICNPWFPKSRYLSFCINNFPFDERLLEEQGYQVGLKEITIHDTYKERHLFCYTNWRAIRDLLPTYAIQNIMKSYIDDPANARTADLGVPGYIAGSIYADLMDHITQPEWISHEYIFGGGDIGVGVSRMSGKTAFCFCGLDTNGFLDVYDEYVCDNTTDRKEPHEIVKEIIDFYERNIQRYYNATGIWLNHNNALTIRVDKNEIAFIDMLNQEAANRGHSDWFIFTTCSKVEISNRIQITRYLMGNWRLRIDSETCDNLLTEMNLSMWKETNANKLTRVNDKDHSINAFEYAIEDFMYLVIRDNDILEVANKLTRRAKKKLNI